MKIDPFFYLPFVSVASTHFTVVRSCPLCLSYPRLLHEFDVLSSLLQSPAFTSRCTSHSHIHYLTCRCFKITPEHHHFLQYSSRCFSSSSPVPIPLPFFSIFKPPSFLHATFDTIFLSFPVCKILRVPHTFLLSVWSLIVTCFCVLLIRIMIQIQYFPTVQLSPCLPS